MKEIRIRCWVEAEGEKLFGPGPLQLLRFIDKHGSLSKAAKEMGMSYKKAWDIVNRLNHHATSPVVHSQKGGASGGGAVITERGKAIINHYTSLAEKLEAMTRMHGELLEIFDIPEDKLP